MLYLAYGSNLNKAQMAWRCPGAKAYGTGMIEDYELLFKGHGGSAYLTIEPKEGERVPVGAWEVDQIHRESLDRYEGFPRFYYRIQMTIPVNNGRYVRRRRCFVYIMHEFYQLGMPSEQYFNGCVDGYADFALDDSYLEKALEKSIKNYLTNSPYGVKMPLVQGGR